jgi:ribosomal protein S18 acetylase RimI-like enzyme
MKTLRLVKNNPSYWEFIRCLKNTDAARANSVSSHVITPDEHKNYMNRYGEQYFICLKEDTPVGYVGANARGYISIAVAEFARGQGLGKFMLKTYCSYEDNATRRAIVSTSNDASLALFESCGFKKRYYIFEKESCDD